MLATLSSRHKIAPIHDVIEENFAWWSPEYFVFDHAHVQGNPAYASAREALRARLMKEGQYELVKEADGVLAYRLVATKP